MLTSAVEIPSSPHVSNRQQIWSPSPLKSADVVYGRPQRNLKKFSNDNTFPCRILSKAKGLAQVCKPASASIVEKKGVKGLERHAE